MKFKVGDQVIVTAGKDKGKTGAIEKVFADKNQVVIKGVNQYKRHVKSREGVEGGILTLERPLTVANIAIIDPKTKKPSRIGYQISEKGVKIRISKKSETNLDTKPVAPAKKTTKKSASSKK